MITRILDRVLGVMWFIFAILVVVPVALILKLVIWIKGSGYFNRRSI